MAAPPRDDLARSERGGERGLVDVGPSRGDIVEVNIKWSFRSRRELHAVLCDDLSIDYYDIDYYDIDYYCGLVDVDSI
jgi:hypothetical protein